MKINWKLRFKNKTTLIAIIAAGLSLIYTALGLFGVVPPVGQENVMEVVSLALTFLALLGIITDPTTPGVNDSARAQGYEAPGVPSEVSEK